MPDDTTHPGFPIPYGYCQCGCGRKTTVCQVTSRTVGWVKGEPLRFIQGHANKGKRLVSRPPLAPCGCGCGDLVQPPVRFVAGHQRRKSALEYIIDPNTGCWVWQRAKLKCGGYGVRRINGKLYRVHRLNYEAKYGPIPDGLVPHHRCENPACVNPDHLEIITTARNIQLGKRAKLNHLWAAVIREMQSMGCSASVIAEAIEFHVGPLHRTTVGSVMNGTSWTE